MSTITHTPSATFHVRYAVENSELATKVLPALYEHASKISDIMMSQRQPFGLEGKALFEAQKKIHTLTTSTMETQKITQFVLIKIAINNGAPTPPKLRTDIVEYTPDCNLVVSYDDKEIPQAFALLRENQPFQDQQALELNSIITAYRNLPYPETNQEPNKVKGAGSSIIDFCKTACKEQQASYLHLQAADTALSFYEKHGLQKVPSKAPDVQAGLEAVLATIQDPEQRKQILASMAAYQEMQAGEATQTIVPMRRTTMFFKV